MGRYLGLGRGIPYKRLMRCYYLLVTLAQAGVSMVAFATTLNVLLRHANANARMHWQGIGQESPSIQESCREAKYSELDSRLRGNDERHVSTAKKGLIYFPIWMHKN